MLKHLIYSTLLLLICVFVGCSDSSVDSLPECVNNEDKIKGCVERDYHHNGQLKIEFPYKNGKENDIAKGYYETGEALSCCVQKRTKASYTHTIYQYCFFSTLSCRNLP